MMYFWNGKKVKVKCLNYEVTLDKETKASWQNSCAGDVRQGLEIELENGESFIIDNNFGYGYYKITQGMGTMHYYHKSVTNPTNIVYIDDSNINRRKDEKSLLKESEKHDFWVKENYPKIYNRMQLLKNNLR